MRPRPPTSWPPDYLQIFKQRIRFLEVLRKDDALRSSVMRFYADPENCAQWISDWSMTFDPRVPPPGSRWMPFVLFKRQIEFVDFVMGCLQDKESGLVEKARDIGASWLCVCITVYLWLFQDGATIGWGSRKEEYVDRNNDPKAIFTKIRQLISQLPPWMLPLGFDMRRYGTFMKIINPANGSSITGEAGDNIGRGGRTTIYFKDESAHYDRPESIEAALGDNTDVQIDISSVNGTANVFYRRRMAGELWEPGKVMPRGYTRVFVFDWRDHPGKTQDWYDLRRAHAEREGLVHIFAQEVDRDYAGSVEGVIIKAEWARAMLDAHIKLKDYGDWFGGEKTAANDVADGGRDKNAYVSRHGYVVQRIEQWAGEAGEAAKIGVPYAIDDGVREYYYDCIGVGVGFREAVNNMQEHPSWPQHLSVLPWDASAKVLNPTEYVIPGDPHSPRNEDVFENLKAQAWFSMRARAWKTYCAVTRGERFPVEELASIPSNLPGAHTLVMQLSQAVKKTSLLSGRTIVDKTPEGNTSPNVADAHIMCYCPTRELSILDVL